MKENGHFCWNILTLSVRCQHYTTNPPICFPHLSRKHEAWGRIIQFWEWHQVSGHPQLAAGLSDINAGSAPRICPSGGTMPQLIGTSTQHLSPPSHPPSRALKFWHWSTVHQCMHLQYSEMVPTSYLPAPSHCWKWPLELLLFKNYQK